MLGLFFLRVRLHLCVYFFFFNDSATTEIYTLSLHDALPIYWVRGKGDIRVRYYDGSYRDIGGNSYYSIDSNEWTRIEVSFTAATDYSSTEFILFVRNTDEARDHLQVDDIEITFSGEIPEPPPEDRKSVV